MQSVLDHNTDSLNQPANIRNHLFWLSTLFLLCLGIILPFIHSGLIFSSTDWLFHASRTQEIYDNLRSGNPFTFIATHTFNHTGAGNFLFYPTLFFYPWAGLRFLFNPITAFYLWVMLVLLAQSYIAYFSLFSFSKNRLQSFLFAALYIIAPLNLETGLETFALGEFVATSFLPLVLLGAYNVFWGNPKKFYPLIFGMIGLVYTHLLSVFLSLQILIVLLLAKVISSRKFELNRFFSLVKSIIGTILVCLPIMVPFQSDFIGQNIFKPGNFLHSFSPFDLFKNSLLNTNGIGTPQNGIGIILLITSLLGWLGVKKNKVYQTIYWLGIGILIFSTSVFPWFFLQNTFFKNLQFTYRYLTYVDLFLAVVASYLISHKLKNISLKMSTKIITALLLVGVTLLSADSSLIGANDGPEASGGNGQPLKNILTANKTKIFKPNGPKGSPMAQFVFLNTKNYHRQFAYTSPSTGSFDYFPKKSVNPKVISGISTGQIRKRPTTKIQKVTYRPNHITYHLKTKTKDQVDFPILKYANSRAKVNRQPIKLQSSSRGTSKINLSAGTPYIEFYYQPSTFYWHSWMIAIFSLFILILNKLVKGFISFWIKHKKTKN